MIELVDQRLKSWASGVVGPDVSVSFEAPSKDTEGVGLYLFELTDEPPARGVRRPPVQLGLRYLVTARAATAEAAHALLGKLVVAAMSDPELRVELAPLAPSVWQSFGTPPLPSFVLHATLRHERPETIAPLVTAPLVVELGPVAALSGRVVGPSSLPITGAEVELPSLARKTRTDRKGQFRFDAVPPTHAGLELRVRAKGRESIVAVSPGGSEEELVVQMSFGEG
ncbi:Pvc16 family protein [Myxococcota bacterium]|nr:Pvc16 family protein [Myxococcota bacterium]